MSNDDIQLRAQGRIGAVLGGKYRIDSVLGAGGMAVVFAATHRNQRRVAIKMLHPEISIHREVRERFLREGYAANTVDHPGAVAVLDDDTAEDGAAYLVMERLEGDEVERICQRRGGRLDAQVVLAIADALLAVLQAAHAKSIVHRDIKPANLYVTHDGSLKVLDFGIARVRDAASGGATATKTGMMLGTPAFMSPEQALSKSNELDGRSDIWSVGATMFTLLSGRFVHEGESLTALIVQAATQPARPLAAVLPGVDPRVAAIVDGALAFDKAARWQDAGAMRNAVRSAYLEMFGTRVGKEPLEQLFTEAAGNASTVYAPSNTPPPNTPPPRAPTPASTPLGGVSQAGPRYDDPRQAPSAPPQAGPMTPWPVQGTPPPGAGMPSYSDARAMSAAPIMAPPGSWAATHAPQMPPPAPAQSKGGYLLVGALVAGATIILCGGVALVAWRVSIARSDTQAAPSSEASSAAASASAPSDDVSSAQAAEEPAPSASASAPALATPKPAPLPVARPYPVPAPAPAPAPAPVYRAPPPMCKAQCADTARACKSSCKAQYRERRDRHPCLVSCEATEKDCKSRAPC